MINSARSPRCGRCGGWLFEQTSGELTCLQCSKVSYPTSAQGNGGLTALNSARLHVIPYRGPYEHLKSLKAQILYGSKNTAISTCPFCPEKGDLIIAKRSGSMTMKCPVGHSIKFQIVDDLPVAWR